MPSSAFYLHITERLFGEWSDFLAGHVLPPEEDAARPQLLAGRRTGNRGSSLAGLPGPYIDADIIMHGVGDCCAETGAVECEVASRKDAPAVAVP